MKIYVVVVGILSDKIDNVFGSKDGAEAYVESRAREQLDKTSLTVLADQNKYLDMVRSRYLITEWDVQK